MAEAEVSKGRLIEGAVAGLAAGLFASWVMSKFHNSWKAAEQGEAEEPTTVKAADAVAEAATGVKVPEPYREPTGTAVHYGFGALLGAAYGVGAELSPATTKGFGTSYGAAVSLVADELAVPMLGLAPPPQEVRAPVHLRGFVSHLVFGAALEAGRRAMLYVITRRGSQQG
jgi:hypothetical protein